MEFKKFEIESFKLCKTKYSDPIAVELYGARFTGDHTFMGKAVFKVNDILKSDKFFWYLKNENGKKIGALTFDMCAHRPKPSLLSFLKNGVKINPIIAIDMTASNGPPYNKNSLHYWEPTCPNNY